MSGKQGPTSFSESQADWARLTGIAGPLYAFWSYGSFPFFLGGVVTKMRDDGAVKTVQYGSSVFHPVLVTTLESGLKIKARLDDIERARSRAQNELHKSYDERLRAEVPELPRGPKQ